MVDIKIGDVSQILTIKNACLCENVALEIAGVLCNVDFIKIDTEYPRVNANFLNGKSFVLDYGKKTLYVLK